MFAVTTKESHASNRKMEASLFVCLFVSQSFSEAKDHMSRTRMCKWHQCPCYSATVFQLAWNWVTLTLGGIQMYFALVPLAYSHCCKDLLRRQLFKQVLLGNKLSLSSHWAQQSWAQLFIMMAEPGGGVFRVFYFLCTAYILIAFDFPSLKDKWKVSEDFSTSKSARVCGHAGSESSQRKESFSFLCMAFTRGRNTRKKK